MSIRYLSDAVKVSAPKEQHMNHSNPSPLEAQVLNVLASSPSPMDIESIMALTKSTRYAVQLALRSLEDSGKLQLIASDPVAESHPLVSPQDNPFGADAIYWLAAILATLSSDNDVYSDPKSLFLPALIMLSACLLGRENLSGIAAMLNTPLDRAEGLLKQADARSLFETEQFLSVNEMVWLNPNDAETMRYMLLTVSQLFSDGWVS